MPEMLPNIEMKTLTTMKVGGCADFVCFAKCERDIAETVAICRAEKLPLLVMGRGSNLLVKDGGLDGVVLVLGKDFAKVSVEGTRVSAQAGATLTSVAQAAQSASLTGFEFAAGIPGSVGGGLFMNAGAYGGEIKNVLISARVLDKDGSIREYAAEELNLSYRHSALMENGGIVLSATFEFQQGDREQISATMADLAQRRREKQPLQYPSCGSFFKRPEGHFAGKLIEDAGLKGASCGGAQISTLHAGFLINTGNATADDILTLMGLVQEKVKRDFGLELEPEVRIVGRD